MSALVKVKGILLRETELALEFQQNIADGQAWHRVWIPRGQCHHISKRLTKEDAIEAVVELPEWLAEAKQLEVEP